MFVGIKMQLRILVIGLLAQAVLPQSAEGSAIGWFL
jgi:hypothetical protein